MSPEATGGCSGTGATVVASCGDSAFATDESCRVVGWNKAASELFGFTAEQVLGRPCCEIVGGRDVYGNRFCDETCPIARMAQHREPVHHFDLDVRDRWGKRRRLLVVAVVVPEHGTSRFTIVHILIPAESETTAQARSAALAPTAGRNKEIDPVAVLTPREVEVLRLLAAGNSSQDIAHLLTVTLATVRSHVQNILHKLEVHSQLEAVSLAFRKGLI